MMGQHHFSIVHLFHTHRSFVIFISAIVKQSSDPRTEKQLINHWLDKY